MLGQGDLVLSARIIKLFTDVLQRGNRNQPCDTVSSCPNQRPPASIVTGKRRGRVLILGLPYFGKLLASQLRAKGWDARYAPHPGRDLPGWLALLPRLARADVIYLVGSRLDRGSPQDRLLRIRRGPVVIHWVGTDVLIAHEEHARGNISARIAHRATHWCDAPWLVDELDAIGVRSEYMPLPVPVDLSEPPPLPTDFRVLLYLPVDSFDREVFDMETLLALPGYFPEVHFSLVPSPAESLPPLPPNLKARGWVSDMDALYRETTVYVRLTSHDGMSFMALEALSRGRYVIWTHPLEGAILASGLDDVRAAIQALLDRHKAGVFPLNDAGRAATLANFAGPAHLDEIDRRLRALIGSSSSPPH